MREQSSDFICAGVIGRIIAGCLREYIHQIDSKLSHAIAERANLCHALGEIFACTAACLLKTG